MSTVLIGVNECNQIGISTAVYQVIMYFNFTINTRKTKQSVLHVKYVSL